MVNTGRPSAACETCKARRIKCDAASPKCSQCIKSRRTCLGYRARPWTAYQAPNRRRHVLNDGQHGLPVAGVRHLQLSRPFCVRKLAANFTKNFSLPGAFAGFVAELEGGLKNESRGPLLYRIVYVFNDVYESLSSLVQSREERIQLHQRYQHALSEVRGALGVPKRSRALRGAVFLLAVLEVWA